MWGTSFARFSRWLIVGCREGEQHYGLVCMRRRCNPAAAEAPCLLSTAWTHALPSRPSPSLPPPPQVLEQRGLLVKHSVTVKRPTAPSQFANHVTTNILHLPRFKPPGIGRKASLTVCC